MFHAGVRHFTVTCLFSHKRPVTLVHDLHERAGLCLLWGGATSWSKHTCTPSAGWMWRQDSTEIRWSCVKLDQPAACEGISAAQFSHRLKIPECVTWPPHTWNTPVCFFLSVTAWAPPSHYKHMLLNTSLCVLVCVLLSWLLLDLSCRLNSRTKELKRLSEKQEHENKHDKSLQHVSLPVGAPLHSLPELLLWRGKRKSSFIQSVPYLKSCWHHICSLKFWSIVFFNFDSSTYESWPRVADSQTERWIWTVCQAV